MKFNSKIIVIFLIVLFCLQSYVMADTRRVGNIKWIRTHNAEIDSPWAPPKFWFALDAANADLQCPTLSFNGETYTVYASDDSASYSMILSAYMAGKKVQISVKGLDHTIVGFCKVSYVTLGFEY